MPIGIVVHGGAGDILSAHYEPKLKVMRDAASEGYTLLKQNRSALDAVEAAVVVMESHPLLNAGYGAYANRDGVVELDAMIMDGRSYHIGAVGAVQRVQHPITLARWIMERTSHHLLVGSGAELFAAEQGMPLVDPASMIVTQEQKDRLAVELDNTGNGTNNDALGDTVGAVAIDTEGNIAVAVSTGGVRDKLPGRVGDSPIAGAGGYADNELGAACATGVGEGIMRSLLTYRAVEAMSDQDAQEASQRALQIFTNKFNGSGGLIAIDRQGRIGIAHNTRFMPVAFSHNDQIFAQIAGQGVVGS